jgi:AcrR family transcriptional regulator
MKRPPSQARSVASTNRMLDAAETLFAAGGAEAVTIESVVREAETSVGSFYARFSNRDGLLAAMHSRFIENFGMEAIAAIAVALKQPTLERALASFTKQAFQSARRNRESILFFVATSATDTSLRHQGLAANPGFAAACRGSFAFSRADQSPESRDCDRRSLSYFFCHLHSEGLIYAP